MIKLQKIDKIIRPENNQTKRAYIYKGFERFWHWSQALLIIFLVITGFEVHGSYELLGYQRAVLYHDIAAWALLVLIIFAVFWHFATGAWKQYVPTMKLVKAQINYYILGIFKGAAHPTKKTSYNKFNPLQRLTYLGFKVFIIPLQVISGFLYMYYMYPENPIHIERLDIIAIIHTFGSFLLIVFLLAHLYLLTTSESPKESFVAMLHGWEEVTVDPEEEHREHLQYAVDKSIAGYYRLDLDGLFISVNDAWMELYKCKERNNIIGMHCSITRNDKNAKRLNGMVSSVLKGKSLRGVYVDRKCFDGTIGKHILSMNPTFEDDIIVGVEGFIIDVTDIHRLQEQMYHSVRNSEAGYYRLNSKGYYEEINDAWLKMYKCVDKDNIIGKHYSLSRTIKDLKQANEIFEKIMKGETISSMIVTRKCKDNTTAQHILSANPVYENNKVIGAEGFIIDISGLEKDI